MADIQLKQGSRELWDISQHFVDLSSTQGLATRLLDGALPGGGLGFISSSYHPSGVPDPKDLAHKAMAEWCKRRPREACTGNLLRVLEEICPSAADAMMALFPGLGSSTTRTDSGRQQQASAGQQLGSALSAAQVERPLTVRRTLRDPWREVIIPLRINFLNPIDIARCCQSKGLIDNGDFNNLRSRTGDSDADRSDRLLQMLYDTEEEGYEIFKSILREFRSPHRHAKLLKRIEEKERELLSQI